MENEIIIGNWSLKKALEEKKKIDEKLASQTPENLRIRSYFYVDRPGWPNDRHKIKVIDYLLDSNAEFPDILVDRITVINENPGFNSNEEIVKEIVHRDLIEETAKKIYGTSKSILCFEWDNMIAKANYTTLFIGREDILAKIIAEDCIRVIGPYLVRGRVLPKFNLDEVPDEIINASAHYNCRCCDGGNIGCVHPIVGNKTKKLAQQYLAELSDRLGHEKYAQAIVQAGFLDTNAKMSDAQKSAIHGVLAETGIVGEKIGKDLLSQLKSESVHVRDCVYRSISL